LPNIWTAFPAHLLAATNTHLIDSLHPFRCSFWVRSFIEPDVFENNVPFDNTAQIYLINLYWKLGLGFKLRLRVALF